MEPVLLLPLAAFIALAAASLIILRRAGRLIASSREIQGFRATVRDLNERIGMSLDGAAQRIDAVRRQLQDHVARITDTLLSAKELHPGKRNSLDALCERYFIDNSRRTVHGALADAQLLAECYLAMTRGQESLMMELEAPAAAAAAAAGLILDVTRLIVQRPSAEELALHEQYLDAMEKDARGASVWRRLLAS